MGAARLQRVTYRFSRLLLIGNEHDKQLKVVKTSCVVRGIGSDKFGHELLHPASLAWCLERQHKVFGAQTNFSAFTGYVAMRLLQLNGSRALLGECEQRTI